MIHKFNTLAEALACLKEHYPFVVVGIASYLDKFNDKMESVLGPDAFRWMWERWDDLIDDQFIVAFDNDKSFVLARLAGVFDGIKILGEN